MNICFLYVKHLLLTLFFCLAGAGLLTSGSKVFPGVHGFGGKDTLNPNRAALRHRPTALSVGLRLAGAVAAPVRFAPSLRLPQTSLIEMLGELRRPGQTRPGRARTP